jgi:hypothetical protein
MIRRVDVPVKINQMSVAGSIRKEQRESKEGQVLNGTSDDEITKQDANGKIRPGVLLSRYLCSNVYRRRRLYSSKG